MGQGTFKGILRNKNIRNTLLFLIDIMLVNLSAWLSLAVRFDFEQTNTYMLYNIIWTQNFLLYTAVCIVVFYIFGLYKSLWRYASINELISIVLASFWSNAAAALLFYYIDVMIPRSFYVINLFVMVAFIGGYRFSYRILRRLVMDKDYKLYAELNSVELKRVLIIGAGEAGLMTAQEMLKARNHQKIPVSFLDDDNNKIGKKINGIKVDGNIDSIERVCEKRKIDEIILAIPSLSIKRKKVILDLCKEQGIKLKILPGIYELIDGKVDIKKIRDVEIEDLLGRDPVRLNCMQINDFILDKTVLVTGGGGSIGSELCRQIIKFRPKTLIIFDIYENGAYDIQNELIRYYKDNDIRVLIGSVRDTKRLDDIFRLYSPNIVFHAAAHKHVPLMQDSPFEAIKNNSFGTLNTAEAAARYNVEKFVLISTDKAVNPTNIMGASKRTAEIIVQDLNRRHLQTEFVSVRFGNVLGSNGSVIPLFKRQIENGGPVTVTDREIIRYFMTIPEAVQLVLQAGAMAKGGEIFILDMGEPVKILNLAEDLIRLSGFEPYQDIDISFTGLRPGEKLYEELLLEEEGLINTGHDKIFIGRPLDIEENFIINSINGLRQSIEDNDIIKLEKYILNLIPGYKAGLRN